MSEHIDEKRIDLVFEGGGVKGIGLVGALSVLYERGFQPQNIAGNSAGAVVASLLAAGYDAPALRDIIAGQDFLSFLDPGPEDRIPLIGKPLSILLELGIFEGETFRRRMEELLSARNVHTFKDLIIPEFAADIRYKYRLQVIASDLTERRVLILPRDAARLGVDPDDLNVALAVRMSMSVPIFFEPVRLRNPKTGREHIIVDGGVLSNYPIWLFDAQGEPEWPTFGLRLVEPEPSAPIAQRLPRVDPNRSPNVVDFITSLVLTMLEAHDRLYIERADFARTIPISTLGVGTLDFGLPPERISALYQSGRTAAEEFLKTWNFEGYIAEFRSGKKHSRRTEIAKELQEAAEE